MFLNASLFLVLNKTQLLHLESRTKVGDRSTEQLYRFTHDSPKNDDLPFPGKSTAFLILEKNSLPLRLRSLPLSSFLDKLRPWGTTPSTSPHRLGSRKTAPVVSWKIQNWNVELTTGAGNPWNTEHNRNSNGMER